jgi:DNA-directed RNA polymerase beta' subunit
MGYIILKVPMLNPAMDKPMIEFMKLCVYDNSLGREDGGSLKFRDGIADRIKKFESQSGHRKMKVIIEDMAGGTNPWSVNIENGGVNYKSGSDKKDIFITEISGTELKSMFKKLVRAPDMKDMIMSIGINLDNADLSDWVIDKIPVLPNIMRLPGKFDKSDPLHWYTKIYRDIIEHNDAGDIAKVRVAYMQLIEKSTDSKSTAKSLKTDVFSSKKEAFIRGHMYSKVGGQMGRSVVIPNYDMLPTCVGIPRRFAKDLSLRILVTNENMTDISAMIAAGTLTHVWDKQTGKYSPIKDKDNVVVLEPGKTLVLRELQDGDIVLLNRQPTLHKNSILAFTVLLHDGECIVVHPSTSKSLN